MPPDDGPLAWPSGAIPLAPGSPLRDLTAAVRSWVRLNRPDHAEHRLQLEPSYIHPDGVVVTCLVCDTCLNPIHKDRQRP